MFWAIPKKIFYGHLDKGIFISYICITNYEHTYYIGNYILDAVRPLEADFAPEEEK